MKKALFLILLASCTFRYAPMTVSDYQSIEIGSKISEVQRKYGDPVSIQNRGNDHVYEYIMRNYLGDQLVSTVRYLFYVDGRGVIVNKLTTTTDAPAFDLLVDPSPP